VKTTRQADRSVDSNAPLKYCIVAARPARDALMVWNALAIANIGAFGALEVGYFASDYGLSRDIYVPHHSPAGHC